ncbi:hypothetical protein GCK32_012528 [Trichostrongylus colubriformis]|uniref:Uncharacterized protein n=1 Tax=Trichostrongylus colubriformis TaxID=6319 RepID=A0AAN8FSJ9_TRICO
MHAVAIVLLFIVDIAKAGKYHPCRTWPSYGLCPFQPHRGNRTMLFDKVVDEDCKDETNKTASSNDSKIKSVVNLDDVVIHNPCSSRKQNCAPSEVLHGNTTAIYSTCCCTGPYCTSLEDYDDGESFSNGDQIPFDEPHQLLVLAFAYATTAATLTISASLTLYKAYTNRLILKNQ